MAQWLTGLKNIQIIDVHFTENREGIRNKFDTFYFSVSNTICIHFGGCCVILRFFRFAFFDKNDQVHEHCFYWNRCLLIDSCTYQIQTSNYKERENGNNFFSSKNTLCYQSDDGEIIRGEWYDVCL